MPPVPQGMPRQKSLQPKVNCCSLQSEFFIHLLSESKIAEYAEELQDYIKYNNSIAIS